MRTFLALLICLCLPFSGHARDAEPKLFEGFWDEVGASFSGGNLLYHLGGIAATPLLIKGGVDATVHDAVKHDRNLYMFPGAVLGSGVVAAAIAYPLYRSGKQNGDVESLGAAFVIVDATVITLATATVLKFVTARTPPDIHTQRTTQELSEEFSFGFGRRGIFTGWPSGHVSHTVAVTSALAHYYPDKSWVKWTGLALSAYTVVTVSTFRSGQMHWFSDAVAGGLMGYAIGSTVGQKSRARIEGREVVSEAVSWTPVVTPEFKGISLSFQF